MHLIERRSFRTKLIGLVLPIAFQQFMLALVSASDAVMLGFVDQTLLSAVSLAGQVQFVFNLFMLALTIGASMFAAQYWGKGDRETVEALLAFTLKFSLLVSAVFFLATAAVPSLLMRIFTSDDALIGAGAPYLRAVSSSYLFCGVSQVYLCFMKNTGHAKMSMLISSAAVVFNILLNAVLIFGLMGLPALYMVGNELGAGELQRAKAYGDRLCMLSVWSGVLSGLLLLALMPLILRLARFTNLTETAREYLREMLFVCCVYLIGKSVNSTLVAGIFCAGGDTKFGFFCDLICMWGIVVPLGFVSAFALGLPVIAVYLIVSLDEFIKLPAVIWRYKKYRWVKDLTVDPSIK